MYRLITACAAVAALLFGATVTQAAPPSPDNPAGRFLGVVPVHGAGHRPGGSAANLTYHSGHVMHTNTTYALYWVPPGYTVSGGYESLINGFLANVAADSGKTSNVYYSDTQYTDSFTGNILYSSTFGGSTVDTSPFPANGCTDTGYATCLTDAQLRAEIDRVAPASWKSSTAQIFLLTPKGVGSCFDSSSQTCAFNYYCAYHSSFTNGSGQTVIYANMPYADSAPLSCASGSHPNGDDADGTINLVSHEHNEAITDWNAGWADPQGNEDGDKCAWNFGHAMGSTSFGQYNQTIGTGKYELQQEWSNRSSGCVLKGT